MLKIGWPNASRPRLGLALPFGDVRKRHLERIFAVNMILTIIAIGSSSGQTHKKIVGGEIYPIVMHGEEAYPFTKSVSPLKKSVIALIL